MTSENDIKELLKDFSFSDAEASIYLSTLSLGKAKVSEIAAKSGLNRTAAYAILKKLLSRGILRKVKVEHTLKFTAMSPEELANKFQKTTDKFKILVPQLAALNKIQIETPAVETTESRLGYFSVYDQISNLPPGSIFRVIEGKRSFIDELHLMTEEQLNIFFNRLVKKKIETKGIFTEESLNTPSQELSARNLKLMKERIWHLKSLPRDILPLDNLALIYDNSVSFLFPEKALVLTIRHQGMVNIMEAMFDALFVFAKTVEDKWT